MKKKTKIEKTKKTGYVVQTRWAGHWCSIFWRETLAQAKRDIQNTGERIIKIVTVTTTEVVQKAKQ